MDTDPETSGAARRPRGAAFIFGRLFDAHEAAGRSLMFWLEPVFALAVRVWMGRIFFDSGFNRFLNWSKQPELFENIHPVPFLPPKLAAIVATAGELILPVLLVLGLFSRVPAIGMLIMAAVIEFIAARTPQGVENGISNPQHILWMLLLAYLFIRGGGPLSIDGLIERQRG